MRFRTVVSNSNLFLRVVQSIDKLSKSAILKLTEDKLHIVVITDVDSGLQLWTDVLNNALFAEYRIDSVHNNEIYLEFSIDNLQRALKSAQGALHITLKLTKKQQLPVLSLIIKNQSSTGRELTLTQDVPVRVLTPLQMENIREPMVPDGHVHIMMPPMNSIRSVADRMKTMGDRVAVGANNCGEMRIRVANDLVDITTYFKGLENLNDDPTQSEALSGRRPNDLRPDTKRFFTAVVDMKNFIRFLQSYHVAPKNVICCIIENHALVFYVYIGSTGFGAGSGMINDNCGSLTYFIPIRQV